ncbi:MAG: DUF3990 domain-containing protein [Tannerellaceae bacterium]|jgi:hypothetical protein|nr:DUF3990 domain-containing protein [Tannerellaceae bacterium]
MKVYHGSYTAIENIDFSFCLKNRDFGCGFYVTQLYEQAETWASRKGLRKKMQPVVTEFEFAEHYFNDQFLKVLRFTDYSEEWLDFIVLNRKNNSEKQAHDYDMIEGPVADDKIATRVDEYLDGIISKEQFLTDLVRYPSHQICFCTIQSLRALSLAKGRIDSAMFHVDDEIVQSLMSDYGMSELEATDIYCTSNTYAKLADESTGLYQNSRQEIYDMLKRELSI